MIFRATFDRNGLREMYKFGYVISPKTAKHWFHKALQVSRHLEMRIHTIISFEILNPDKFVCFK